MTNRFPTAESIVYAYSWH